MNTNNFQLAPSKHSVVYQQSQSALTSSTRMSLMPVRPDASYFDDFPQLKVEELSSYQHTNF